MRTLTHPTDINWYMIRLRSGRPWLPTIVFNTLAVVLIVFLTTPAATLSIMAQTSELKSFLALDWVDQSSNFSKYLVQDLIPALIVLGINELLILVMNFLVDFEKKERFSIHQRSQMRKTFLYFLFNMLIIPGLTVSTVNNVYELINSGVSDMEISIKKLFNLKDGNFFMALVLGNAGGGFFAGLNVLYILAANYFSPSISMKTKVIERENEKWLKDNDMLFSWGVYYSLNLMIIGIGFVFQ